MPPASAPEQQVVLVTGCTKGGIGWHLCAQLAARGARVFATARRVPAMEGLAERGCRLLALDVTDSGSVRRAVAAIVEEAGRIDVVVNNAGIATRKPAVDFTDEEVRALFDVNYFGMVAVNDAVLPHMIKQRSGKVFNIGSGLGYCTLPMMSHYSATKHAARAYSDVLRMELCPFGVRVCFVAPGYIRTHIGDERHDLPPGSLYHAFPRLARAMAESVFLGTTYEAATPADTFCSALARVVLSRAPPRHYRSGHLSWFPWLMSMITALWVLDLSYGLRFGLMPNSMVGRRRGGLAASKAQ